jgi:hypothetical protein
MQIRFCHKERREKKSGEEMREDEWEGGVKRGEESILFRAEPEYSNKFHAKT